jgi:transposase
MDSMTDATREIVVGVDAHTDTHDAALLDDCGRLLGAATFSADATGYRELLAWAKQAGTVAAIGVESTGSYAAGLVRHLRAEGLEVLEVNQPHPHARRRRGKSDSIDAELAARHVLAASSVVIAKDTTGIVEAIRQLRVARDGAVKARSAALNALTGLVVTAPEDLRRQLAARKTARGRATLCARYRPDQARLHEPINAAKAALKSLARRVIDLDGEIAGLDRQLKQLVGIAAPATTARVAVSTGHAATLLVAAGQNIERLRSEASFAALCAASPIPVSTDRPIRPSPPQLRRCPRRQPRPAHDRRLPSALLRTHPRLRGAPHDRGQDQDRNHPLPQALHRPRDLPRARRRPTARPPHPPTLRKHLDQLRRRPDRPHHQDRLTSIGTSGECSTMLLARGAPPPGGRLSPNPSRSGGGSIWWSTKNDLLSRTGESGCMGRPRPTSGGHLMVQEDGPVGLDGVRVCFDDERVVSDAGSRWSRRWRGAWGSRCSPAVRYGCGVTVRARPTRGAR